MEEDEIINVTEEETDESSDEASPHPLEYIVTGALTECSQGAAMMKFTVTNTTPLFEGIRVGNEDDKAPFVNIPTFIYCKKTKKPCAPAPSGKWKDTWPKVTQNGKESLIFRCTIDCAIGGKISFVTSGQIPLPSEIDNEINNYANEAKNQLAEIQKASEAVGESGFVEGMVPLWGSGRDFVNAAQTGDGWGMAANAGFFVWDAVSIVAGVFSFGSGTAAMQGGKALMKGGTKATMKEMAEKAVKSSVDNLTALGRRLITRAAALKQGVQEGVKKMQKMLGKKCVKACFPAGTLIHTEEGLCPIEQIRVGDKVWAYDAQTGKAGLKKVVLTGTRMADQLVELELEDELIQSTPDHPFYVVNAGADIEKSSASPLHAVTHAGEEHKEDTVLLSSVWMQAMDLQPGDELYLPAQQRTVKIDAVRLIEGRRKVYNFDVEDYATYFVGEAGVLVHNGTCIKKPRKPSLKNKHIDHSKTTKHPDGSVTYYDKAGNSVTYNKDGWPDFSKYSKADVQVNGMNGVYRHDASLANQAAGLKGTPDGYVWHHVQDGRTMQLIPQNIHNAFQHTGGASIIRGGGP